MVACKMISFNEQRKNLSLTENILFALCLYFSLSYLGVINYNSMGKMYQTFYQYSHYF